MLQLQNQLTLLHFGLMIFTLYMWFTIEAKWIRERQLETQVKSDHLHYVITCHKRQNLIGYEKKYDFFWKCEHSESTLNLN